MLNAKVKIPESRCDFSLHDADGELVTPGECPEIRPGKTENPMKKSDRAIKGATRRANCRETGETAELPEASLKAPMEVIDGERFCLPRKSAKSAKMGESMDMAVIVWMETVLGRPSSVPALRREGKKGMARLEMA
jgi:hypothetical protein